MKKRCCRRIYRSRSGSFPSQYAGVAQLVEQLIRKNQVCDSKSEYANVAQSVEQLIRNQQVVCSSHIASSTSSRTSYRPRRHFYVIAHSFRRSSFPNRTRFAGLRFGLRPAGAGWAAPRIGSDSRQTAEAAGTREIFFPAQPKSP